MLSSTVVDLLPTLGTAFVLSTTISKLWTLKEARSRRLMSSASSTTGMTISCGLFRNHGSLASGLSPPKSITNFYPLMVSNVVPHKKSLRILRESWFYVRCREDRVSCGDFSTVACSGQATLEVVAQERRILLYCLCCWYHQGSQDIHCIP